LAAKTFVASAKPEYITNIIVNKILRFLKVAKKRKVERPMFFILSKGWQIAIF
jgi:hypothetical protein